MVRTYISDYEIRERYSADAMITNSFHEDIKFDENAEQNFPYSQGRAVKVSYRDEDGQIKMKRTAVMG